MIKATSFGYVEINHEGPKLSNVTKPNFPWSVRQVIERQEAMEIFSIQDAFRVYPVERKKSLGRKIYMAVILNKNQRNKRQKK